MPENNGHNPLDNDDNNIIRIPTLEEREKIRKEKRERENRPQEPFLNLPPTTKKLITFLIITYLVMEIVKYTLPKEISNLIFYHLAFLPSSFTGETEFLTTTIITPISYMFLHAGLIHIIVNIVMTAIFASITEKWLGGKIMLTIFFIGGVTGAFAHLLVAPTSIIPLIGASGGISALFASTAIMMYRTGMLGYGGKGIKHPLVIFIGIWIIISLLFGLMDSSISWASHIGGMIGGVFFTKYIMK